MTRRKTLNPDFLDALSCLVEAGADFVVVGAHALAVHGIPRATGDIYVFVRPTPENADRAIEALRAFGAPIDSHGVTTEDLARAGTVFQIGLPPRRVDILTEISGVTFDEAWESRVEVEVAGINVGFLGREALIRNKTASARLDSEPQPLSRDLGTAMPHHFRPGTRSSPLSFFPSGRAGGLPRQRSTSPSPSPAPELEVSV